jgi:glycosyltransferase involved in cell wall biosynthesis
MDVSIVIVSWNRRDLLRQCLESIDKESGDVSLETFVVDNAIERWITGHG